MSKDMRSSKIYRLVEQHFEQAMGPGLGRITGAADPAISPGGDVIAITGTTYEGLTEAPRTRVCLVDAATGDLRVVSPGPHDRRPRWSPDSSTLAYLSDEAEPEIHQLCLLQDGSEEPAALPAVDGTVEDFRWAADSRRLLALVAGRGADIAGAQGSSAVRRADDATPSWMPEVLRFDDEATWRWLEVHDLEAGTRRRVPSPGINVWEADWAAAETVVAIVSGRPDESSWYTAHVAAIDIATGTSRVLFEPRHQAGALTASPDGRHVAMVDALSSDRGVIAGDLVVVSVDGGASVRVDTGDVDVSEVTWRGADVVVWAGVRGLDSVIGEYSIATGRTTELWCGSQAIGFRCAQVSAAPAGRTAFVAQDYTTPHTVVVLEERQVREVCSFRHAGTEHLATVGGSTRPVRWSARDGITIEGLVTTPAGTGPFPLVVLLHGGPVWAFQDRWTMGYHYTPVLVSQGYAVLHPNPRGSSGRGVEFVSHVYGDVGGEDAHDVLCGVDELVASGVADPDRLAVTGGSYGGYLSAWIITQDDRFAAAVPIAEISNWVSLHHTSNLGRWIPDVLGGSVGDPDGPYRTRSPITHVDKVRTPVLHITGALDRCTPPTQAVEYHNALREHGVESECVIYPEEGHGVRRFPAVIDHLARMIEFLDRHLGR